MLQLLVLLQCYQVVVNIIKRDAYHNDDDGADNNDDNDHLRIISPATILSEAAALIRSVTCLLRSFG